MLYKDDINKFLPKPGMRIIKTAIAVFLCFCIDALRGVNQPIYSVISAIICMQKDIDNSWIVSKNRIIGTFAGGIFGVITLYAVNIIPYMDIDILRFALISAMIVPMLLILKLMNRAGAASVTGVVYASIVILHVGSDQVMYYALTRMLDTIVGIMVSLFVNVMFTRKVIDAFVHENNEE